jgi:hypothetical protein
MCYEKQCPCTRLIPDMAIFVKTQGQGVKIYDSNVKVSLHPIFVKYETKVTMANIIIFKRAGHRI